MSSELIGISLGLARKSVEPYLERALSDPRVIEGLRDYAEHVPDDGTPTDYAGGSED